MRCTSCGQIGICYHSRDGISYWNCHICGISWEIAIPYNPRKRIYNVNELKKMRPGTCFMHERLGKCMLLRDKNEKLYMVFKKGTLAVIPLSPDWHTWDNEMEILSN